MATNDNATEAEEDARQERWQNNYGFAYAEACMYGTDSYEASESARQYADDCEANRDD